jgi:hypothetical protein
MKIKDIQTALEVFETASKKQAEATDQGDYKTGNKCYDRIIKSTDFLKKENALNRLEKYFTNSSIGVRLWSACYLLPINEQGGIKVLEEIAKSSGIHSLTAKTAIDEWRKGNLKFS